MIYQAMTLAKPFRTTTTYFNEIWFESHEIILYF